MVFFDAFIRLCSSLQLCLITWQMSSWQAYDRILPVIRGIGGQKKQRTHYYKLIYVLWFLLVFLSLSFSVFQRNFFGLSGFLVFIVFLFVFLNILMIFVFDIFFGLSGFLDFLWLSLVFLVFLFLLCLFLNTIHVYYHVFSGWVTGLRSNYSSHPRKGRWARDDRATCGAIVTQWTNLKNELKNR